LNAEMMQVHASPLPHASHSRTETLLWDETTGWISWQTSQSAFPLPLCWIPVERRGCEFESHGTTIVIGAYQGIITILDFSDVIAMLGNADQAPFM
jgi:hypothetical protein